MHIPVLLDEILKAAAEAPIPPRRFLDATFGRGGHTSALIKKFENLRVVALDRDPEAILYGKEHFPQIEFHHCDFARFQELQLELGFDLILLDLGVSSPQLDQAERGFSFYHNGPLDMRMDPTRGERASALVNEWPKEALVELFQNLGEIRRPHRVVDAIVADRKTKKFETTNELSQLIERIEGWRKKGQHPATKYFLALRLAVNQELEQVQRALPNLIEALEIGGRLMVITFHSLEDRIVKYSLRESMLGRPVNKKVIQPTWPEQKSNPRARSAKLRIFERTV